ncbi:MAG: hypothetical protein R3B06_09990 [Kofleriaceae bacterium]
MKLHTCAFIVAALAASAACNRPSEADCKKAIANIRQLTGTDKLSTEKSNDARLLRSCKGAGKRTSVKCAINATSVDELKACGLLKAAELEELDQLDRDLNRLRPVPAPVAPPPAPPTAAPAPVTVDPSAPAPVPGDGTAPAAPTAAPTAPTAAPTAPTATPPAPTATPPAPTAAPPAPTTTPPAPTAAPAPAAP